jgi:hypothetical protein
MEKQIGSQPLIHNFSDQENKNSIPLSKLIVYLLIAVFVGAFAGYGLTKVSKNTNGPLSASNQLDTTKKTAGIQDKKTFKDQAEGLLKEGGVEGEGNFHLERPGGESQNVYLTSSTVDLSEYVGKKVRVWGATFKGQHAGWLMDVGLVELIQ